MPVHRGARPRQSVERLHGSSQCTHALSTDLDQLGTQTLKTKVKRGSRHQHALCRHRIRVTRHQLPAEISHNQKARPTQTRLPATRNLVFALAPPRPTVGPHTGRPRPRPATDSSPSIDIKMSCRQCTHLSHIPFPIYTGRLTLNVRHSPPQRPLELRQHVSQLMLDSSQYQSTRGTQHSTQQASRGAVQRAITSRYASPCTSSSRTSARGRPSSTTACQACKCER